jgi:hypothetical protein
MKYFKTYEAYRYGVKGVGSLRNSLAALKRQNINGRYVDPEILAQAIRNEYEAITGEKYEDEVQMSMNDTIADIIGHYKLDGPDFMAAWDKVVKESVNEGKRLSFKDAGITDTMDLSNAMDALRDSGISWDQKGQAFVFVSSKDYASAIKALGIDESVNDAYNNLEKIFGTDQESMDMFQGIEDNGTVKDMIEFIDEFGNEEMLSRYGIRSAAKVKKLAKTIMGESVTEKKDFKPHMMYDPKTGKGYKADTYEDHVRMGKLGYVHENPKNVTESTSGKLLKPKRGKVIKFNHKKYPELAGEFFDLISTAYATIGGHAKIKSPDDVFSDPEWNYWEGIDIHGDQDFDIVMFGKKTKFGIKYSGVGHDGSSAAKREYIAARGKDLNKLGFYIEVSGRIADILLGSYNVPVVSDEKTVEKVLGKKVDWIGTKEGTLGTGWYSRRLGGKMHDKILLGNPKI